MKNPTENKMINSKSPITAGFFLHRPLWAFYKMLILQSSLSELAQKSSEF